MTHPLLTYLHKTQGRDLQSLSETLLKKTADGTPTDELEDNALELALGMNVEYLANQNHEIPKAEYDKIHKAAKADTLAKVEEWLKTTHGVDGKGWQEMITNFGVKSAKTALSDDAWEIDPRTAKERAAAKAAIEQLQAENAANLLKVETEAQRKERFKNNLSKIETAMAAAGVVLPSNPEVAANQKADFFKLFEQYDFEEKETGTYLKAGEGFSEYVKDGHQIPVKLEDYVTSLAAKKFDIQKQPARQSPGNDAQGTPPAPSTEWSEKNLPKTTDEFNAAYYKMPAGEERTKFAVAFEQSQSRQPG